VHAETRQIAMSRSPQLGRRLERFPRGGHRHQVLGVDPVHGNCAPPGGLPGSHTPEMVRKRWAPAHPVPNGNFPRGRVTPWKPVRHGCMTGVPAGGGSGPKLG
jgi:hypothetical protein